jgi:hypothetical protein
MLLRKMIARFDGKVDHGVMFDSSNTSYKLISTSVLIVSILLSLLGGLALVVRSLRNVNLTLFLELKKDD